LLLDDDVKPSFTGAKFLVLDGHNYREPTLIEMTQAFKVFNQLRSTFSDKTIADRTLAPQIVNAAHIKNTTRVTSAVITAPGWSIGIETVDGELVAYLIDQEQKDTLEIHAAGYVFNNKLYHIEDKYDAEVLRMLGRLQDRSDEIDKAMSQHFPEFPREPEELAKQTNVWKFLDALTAIADILATVSAAGILMFASEEEEVQFERRQNRHAAYNSDDVEFCEHGVPLKSPCEECKAKKNRFERRQDRHANYNQKDCETCEHGVPLKSPCGECKEAKNQFECVTDEETLKDITTMYKAYYGPSRDNCEYGILLEGQFYWLHEQEKRKQQWIGFCIDARKITIHVLKDEKTNIDRVVADHIKGKHFILPPSSESDLGEAWADYAITGKLPEDPETLSIIRSMPARRITLSRAAQAQQVEDFQGSFDPQARRVLLTVKENQVEILNPAGEFSQTAIMLKDNIGICNEHAPTDFTIRDKEVVYKVERLARSKRNDVCLFKVLDKKYQPKKNIFKLLCTVKDLGKFLGITNGRIALMLGLGKEHPILMTAEGTTETACVEAKEDGGQIRYRSAIGYFGYTGVTEYGDCGSPVVIMAPTLVGKWCGIHSRGTDNISIAAPLTQEYVKAMLDDSNFEASQIQSRPHEYLEYEAVKYQCTDTKLNVVAKPKLKIHVPTSTTKYLSGLNLPLDTEPTIKSKKDPRNVFRKDLLKEGIARYGQKLLKTDIREEVIHAAHCIGEYLATKMDAQGMTTHILTNTESINGAPNCIYPASKSIDRNGSVGYPYVQLCPGRNSKQDFLYQNEKSLLWYFRDDIHSKHIQSDVNLLIDDGYKGISHDIPWVAYPKDEPAKLKKIYDIDNQKTRVFFAGPMSYQLAYRRAFGAALWRITELHSEIPCRVGISPTSLEWQELAFSHLSQSNYGFDSDMENWDGTVPIEFLEAVPIIYNIIYKRTDPNWSPDDDLLRTTLHKAVEGALVIVYDKVYKLDQAMASGFPGTAIENSLINWMLFFCSWKRIMLEKNPQYASFRHFMKHVCLSVYGDDNVCSVVEPLAEHFHFNTFKEMAAQFGFKVTDAAKTGKDVPNQVPFEQLTFLKRSFKKDGWFYVPALDLTSLRKTLCWINSHPAYEYTGRWKRNNYPLVFAESLRNLFLEICLHGPEVYEQFADEIKQAAKGTRMEINIPPYAEARSLTAFV
jgi:hypothetical protein